MRNVVFVAPFPLETTMRFARAVGRLAGVRMLGIAQEAPTGADRALFNDVVTVRDGLDTRQLVEATRLLEKRYGVLHRLVGILEPLQVQLAEVRQELGIPGTSPITADLFRDKARMKDELRRHGLPCARHKLVRTWADAEAFVREVGFPMVVKPPAGMGSKSTWRIANVDELRAALGALHASPERPALAALLAGDAVQHVELHHRRGHDPGILDLATLLRVPVDIVVHDYAAFCQRIALVGPTRQYCGEPDLAGCATCVAAQGSLLQEAITMPALLHRSTRDLAAARRVIAPSLDTARRIARHFPGVTANVQPWDSTPPPIALAPPVANPASSGTRIAVIGAIGTEKGYDVLLACVADAAARRLAIEFVVVGTTIDDAALMAAGPARVTARYAEADGVALIKEQGAALAFLPSIWPETWCYALSTAWAAGLDVAAFDLGAPAERIRQAGRGWLLPLGLPAAAINDALLAASRGARHRTGDQR